MRGSPWDRDYESPSSPSGATLERPEEQKAPIEDNEVTPEGATLDESAYEPASAPASKNSSTAELVSDDEDDERRKDGDGVRNVAGQRW